MCFCFVFVFDDVGFNILRCRADIIIIITDKQGANKQGAYSFMRFSQRLGHLVAITLRLSSAYHVRGPVGHDKSNCFDRATDNKVSLTRSMVRTVSADVRRSYSVVVSVWFCAVLSTSLWVLAKFSRG